MRRACAAVLAALCVLVVAGLASAWQGSKAPPRPSTAQKKTAKRKPAAVRKPAAKPAPKAAAPTAAGGQLASLVQAYREAPTPARRAAVEQYAAAHAKDNNGALARFALGVAAYETKDFAGAAGALATVQARLPQIADYVSYYLAAARVEAGEFAGTSKILETARGAEPPSPLAGRSWLVEARALQAATPAEAVRLLREHYADLPQPEGDVTLGDAYRAANDLPHAAASYQRVHYYYLSGDAADRAAAALAELAQSMGAAYPQPSPQQVLRRADRLMGAREYTRARAEYESIPAAVTGLEAEQARVRVGATRLLAGNASGAASYLRGLDLEEPEADAERQYYLVEAARRLDNDEAMMAAIKRLERHRKSPWRAKALLSAANRYLLVNSPDDFVPLYKDVYEDFPEDPMAGLARWKVTFQAYLHGKSNADNLLREHLRRHPAHATTGAAIYFLGRHAEREGDLAGARACYQRLARSFPNHYYAIVARERLQRAGVAAGRDTGEIARFIAGLSLVQSGPVPQEPERTTTARIERSRLLRRAGLKELADGELRFGARNEGQPELLAMELASAAENTHVALRAMKSLSPGYLSLPVDQAPRRYWEMLFPLPYRAELEAGARTKGVDPFLLAGLIRQESEFNPQAVSAARAYGLTQVRPGTGRQFARRAGVSRFSTRVLFQPAANLRIGTTIFRSMLESNNGNVEQTLAAYNAGPSRVATWTSWNEYREPAEFIESIPFTETRDYVQAVLRNADMYRRLYR